MKALPCALVIACLAIPARADIVEVDVTGTLAAYPSPQFPSFGLGLPYGSPFSVVWTIDTSCFSCAFNGALTVSGQSIVIGPGVYNVANIDPHQFYINTTVIPGQLAMNTYIETSVSFPFSLTTPFSYDFNPMTDNKNAPAQLGGGFIAPGSWGYFDISNITTYNQSVAVPAPIVGAGWPGIILAAACVAWWRKRK